MDSYIVSKFHKFSRGPPAASRRPPLPLSLHPSRMPPKKATAATGAAPRAPGLKRKGAASASGAAPKARAPRGPNWSLPEVDMLIQLEKHYKNNHNFRNADSMWATIAEKINSSFWKEGGAGARQGAPCQAKWRATRPKPPSYITSLAFK